MSTVNNHSKTTEKFLKSLIWLYQNHANVHTLVKAYVTWFNIMFSLTHKTISMPCNSKLIEKVHLDDLDLYVITFAVLATSVLL